MCKTRPTTTGTQSVVYLHGSLFILTRIFVVWWRRGPRTIFIVRKSARRIVFDINASWKRRFFVVRRSETRIVVVVRKSTRRTFFDINASWKRRLFVVRRNGTRIVVFVRKSGTMNVFVVRKSVRRIVFDINASDKKIFVVISMSRRRATAVVAMKFASLWLPSSWYTSVSGASSHL